MTNVTARTTISDEELATFVGRSAGYYRKKWAKALTGRGVRYDRVAVAGLMIVQPNTRFNWAAFFLPPFWLAYRKMYALAAGCYGVAFSYIFLTEFVYVGILGRHEPPPFIDNMIGLTVALLCGSFGNRWYLSHARNTIVELRAQGLEEAETLRRLTRRGGTSLLAAFGCFALFVAALAAIVVAVVLLWGTE